MKRSRRRAQDGKSIKKKVAKSTIKKKVAKVETPPEPPAE